MYYRIRAHKPPVVYKKIGDLFEFCIGGGLIKSGGLFGGILNDKPAKPSKPE